MKTFEDIAAEEGWTLATQVCVLLRYIENQDSPEAFTDFLEGQRCGEMRIFTEAWSDDHAVEIHFDSAPWFEQASEEEILRLVEEGWSHGYMADSVAEFCENETSDLFMYLDAMRKAPGKRDTIGFECRITESDAMDWITEYRPALAEKIEAFLKEENQ